MGSCGRSLRSNQAKTRDAASADIHPRTPVGRNGCTSNDLSAFASESCRRAVLMAPKPKQWAAALGDSETIDEMPGAVSAKWSVATEVTSASARPR
jgi:hypothetical protein